MLGFVIILGKCVFILYHYLIFLLKITYNYVIEIWHVCLLICQIAEGPKLKISQRIIPNYAQLFYKPRLIDFHCQSFQFYI